MLHLPTPSTCGAHPMRRSLHTPLSALAPVRDGGFTRLNLVLRTWLPPASAGLVRRKLFSPCKVLTSVSAHFLPRFWCFSPWEKPGEFRRALILTSGDLELPVRAGTLLLALWTRARHGIRGDTQEAAEKCHWGCAHASCLHVVSGISKTWGSKSLA